MTSPFANIERLKSGEIVAILEGTDSTTACSIQARYSYTFKDILYDERFVNMVERNEKGKVLVDFTKFDDTVPVK